MKTKTVMTMLGVLLLASLVIAQTRPAPGSWGASVGANICAVVKNLRSLLELIAGAVATLIIVMNGVKWIGSSDDPGARKQAKEGIVHAIVGLVIVLIAVEVVTLIYSTSCGT